MLTKKKTRTENRVALPGLASRPDYEYLNDESLRILARGYLPSGIARSDLKARAIERVNSLIHRAETILGRELPAMRLGIKRGWVSPSSPIWSNFGTDRGLPISCNGSRMADSVDSIAYKVFEVGIMTKEGAGTSVYMGDLRPAGSPISVGGKSLGPVHFARLIQEQIGVISQSDVRRGNCSIYLPIEHDDIDEWLKMRSIAGGINHPIQHLSFGVTITDKWMEEMLAEAKGGAKRKLITQIVNKRRATGYPYIVFIDNANNARHDRLKDLALEIVASNLCTEIMLPSTENESFVCDLSSINLLHYDEWKDTTLVGEMVYFLDAVMSEYIEKCRMKGRRGLADAMRFAERWRALGIGTLGYHSMLQQKMIPFESDAARALNVEVHKLIHDQSLAASRQMAKEYGEAPGMKGTGQRHLTLQAIAPTRSSSLILGQVSKGIEPWEANIFEDDNAKTTFVQRNKALTALLDLKGKNTEAVWMEIARSGGSVRSLDFLTDHEKAVFKTFGEIDQMEIVRQNNDRTPFVDQGISLNLSVHPDASLADNVKLLVEAWKGGSKSLYYHQSVNRAQDVLRKGADECEACEA